MGEKERPRGCNSVQHSPAVPWCPKKTESLRDNFFNCLHLDVSDINNLWTTDLHLAVRDKVPEAGGGAAAAAAAAALVSSHLASAEAETEAEAGGRGRTSLSVATSSVGLVGESPGRPPHRNSASAGGCSARGPPRRTFTRPCTNKDEKLRLSGHESVLAVHSSVLAQQIAQRRLVRSVDPLQGRQWSHGEIHDAIIGWKVDEVERREFDVDAPPRQFKKIMAWMYGEPFVLHRAQILQWPAKGCDVLQTAREFGLDLFEKALRQALQQIAETADIKVVWSLLHVCFAYDLHPEGERVCSVVARGGGRGAPAKVLRRLPLSALSALLRSPGWIVDGESEVFAVLERWLHAHVDTLQDEAAAGASDEGQSAGELPPAAGSSSESSRSPPALLSHRAGPDCEGEAEAATPDAEEVFAQRTKAQDSLRAELLSASATWGLRWGCLSQCNLKWLAMRGVIPKGFVKDCAAWVQMVREKPQRAMEAQRQQAESKRKTMQRRMSVENAVSELSAVSKDIAAKERQSEVEARVNKNGAGKLRGQVVEAKGKANKLRMQLAVAKEMADQREDMTQAAKANVERLNSARLAVPLSTDTTTWRNMGSQKLPDAVRDFLKGSFCQEDDRQVRQAVCAFTEVGDWAAVKKRLTSNSTMNISAAEDCPFMVRRRCFHVELDDPEDSSYFEIFRRSGGRTSMRFRCPGEDVQGEDRSGATISNIQSKKEVTSILGSRTFEAGRHAMLLRISLRPRPDEPSSQNGRHQRSVLPSCALEDLAKALKLGVELRSPLSDEEEEEEERVGHVRSVGAASHTGLDGDSPGRRPGRLHASTRVKPGARIFVPKDKLEERLTRALDLSADASVAETFMILTWDIVGEGLSLAVEATSSEDAAAAGRFFAPGPRFDRWLEERCLLEDQEFAVGVEPGYHMSFVLELNLEALGTAVGGAGGVADLELLPADSLKRSWWVDSMARSVDGVPRLGCPWLTGEGVDHQVADTQWLLARRASLIDDIEALP